MHGCFAVGNRRRMIYKSIDIKFCVARNTGERVCYTSRTLLSGIIICRERLVEKKKKKNANCKYKTKIRVIATISIRFLNNRETSYRSCSLKTWSIRCKIS